MKFNIPFYQFMMHNFLSCQKNFKQRNLIIMQFSSFQTNSKIFKAQTSYACRFLWGTCLFFVCFWHTINSEGGNFESPLKLINYGVIFGKRGLVSKWCPYNFCQIIFFVQLKPLGTKKKKEENAAMRDTRLPCFTDF